MATSKKLLGEEPLLIVLGKLVQALAPDGDAARNGFAAVRAACASLKFRVACRVVG